MTPTGISDKREPHNSGEAVAMVLESGSQEMVSQYPPLPALESIPWKYDMRRQMQEIIPNLFLGPYASATRSNFQNLKEAGFTHIVCVRQLIERNLIRPNFPDAFKYLVVEMVDDCFERVIPQIRSASKFLKDCLDNAGKVLVHGNGGSSRSATIVIAFIMSRYGLTSEEARRYVQTRRFCINPNDNFVEQLREYEPIYRAQNDTPIMQRAGSCKRPRDTEDSYTLGSATGDLNNFISSEEMME